MPRDALVIRFRPTNPDAVFAWAEKEHRRTDRYRLSVFADAKREGESAEDLRVRLLEASELAGVDRSRNSKYYVCARAGELLDRGFTFWKDGDDDEVSEHYSVDLGPGPTVEDVVRFLEPFGSVEVR